MCEGVDRTHSRRRGGRCPKNTLNSCSLRGSTKLEDVAPRSGNGDLKRNGVLAWMVRSCAHVIDRSHQMHLILGDEAFGTWATCEELNACDETPTKAVSGKTWG